MTKQILIKTSEEEIWPCTNTVAIKENRNSCSGGSCRRHLSNLVAVVDRGMWIGTKENWGNGLRYKSSTPTYQKLSSTLVVCESLRHR